MSLPIMAAKGHYAVVIGADVHPHSVQCRFLTGGEAAGDVRPPRHVYGGSATALPAYRQWRKQRRALRAVQRLNCQSHRTSHRCTKPGRAGRKMTSLSAPQF
jgi:hypothetical protein